ncbi:hypothetical protein ACTXT7_013100 [Hymenolepis weldensis]
MRVALRIAARAPPPPHHGVSIASLGQLSSLRTFNRHWLPRSHVYARTGIRVVMRKLLNWDLCGALGLCVTWALEASLMNSDYLDWD